MDGRANKMGDSYLRREAWNLLGLALLLASLAGLSEYNYLLFHVVAELSTVSVAVAALMLAWNVRPRMSSDFLPFVAMVLAAAGSIDLLHTLAYEGMGVFPARGSNLATQLWIAARYVEAAGLLVAPVWLTRRMPLKSVAAALIAVVALLLASIFHPRPLLPAFPACFVGELTPFKIASEYVISAMLVAATVFLWTRRRLLDPQVFGDVVAAFGLTVVSEISFTQYVSVYGPFNMIGHLLKVAAFYMAYKGLVEAGLRRPYDVLFRDLSRSERRYRELFESLRTEEERLRQAVAVTGIGIYDHDQRTDALEWSPQMRRICGFEDDVIPAVAAFLERVHPDDRGRTVAGIEAAGDPAGKGELRIEHRLLLPDGSIRWVAQRAQTFFEERDGSRRAVRTIGAVADVTELKLAEETLQAVNTELERRVAERTNELRRRADQLARLTSELTLTEQKERSRLARMLHDHLQQLLVGARLRIEILPRKAGADLRREAEEVGGLLDESIRASRDLTAELDPPVLTEEGLAAGLRWLAGWMKDKHGLDVTVQAEGDATLAGDVRLLVFQSVREALFNVVKHAGTLQATVELRRNGPDQVRVVVSDGGSGFDPALLEALDESSCYGLFSIRERLQTLGGRFEIESRRGGGTRVTMVTPRVRREGGPAGAAGADA